MVIQDVSVIACPVAASLSAQQFPSHKIWEQIRFPIIQTIIINTDISPEPIRDKIIVIGSAIKTNDGL